MSFPRYSKYKVVEGRNKPASSRKIYNTLLILLHGMDTITRHHHWRNRLKDLIFKHTIPVADMDFPDNWIDRPIWQEVT